MDSKQLTSQIYAKYCEQLGDLYLKRNQINELITEIESKVKALNEFHPIMEKLESDLKNKNNKTNTES